MRPDSGLAVYENALDRCTVQLGERLNLIDQGGWVVLVFACRHSIA